MGFINSPVADLTRCAQLWLFSPSAFRQLARADGICARHNKDFCLGFARVLLWYVFHLTDAVPGPLLLQNAFFK